ncbi:MAG: histidinol dehydrogenase, partial [Alphaproteobacteria bacterium]|nr:histidinol dehydrogenase [Alphaproteobacteria bacterium]
MRMLSTSDPEFGRRFARIVADRRESTEDVAASVSSILSSVKTRGDDALVEYTARLDHYELAGDADWSIPAEACADAYRALDGSLRDALDLAAARIRAYHEAQLPEER